MLSNKLIKIGVISDTHLPYRLRVLPPAIAEIFAGVDLILHAGDVDKYELLQPLTKIAPLYAVRGNIHFGDLSFGGKDLPSEVFLTLANRRIVVTHGHRKGIMGSLYKIPEFVWTTLSQSATRRLNERTAHRLGYAYPDANIIIFGHTHASYCKAFGDTLYFNPGAVAPTHNKWTSVGLIILKDDSVETEIVPLENVKYSSNGHQDSFKQIHFL